jgi:hypothetical protein
MEDNGPRRSSILDAEAFSVLVHTLAGRKRRGLTSAGKGAESGQ